MVYHLSLRLGFPHPDYLLPYLSAGQLLDWQRYAEQYGVSIARDDIHWGMLLSMFFNANRGEGSQPKPATDFMPYYEPVEQEEEPEQFAQQIQGLLRGKLCRSSQT